MTILPDFNDANVNAWFQTIQTDAAAWSQFATDLQVDFLGAFELRFNVSDVQRNVFMMLTEHQKLLIQCTATDMSRYLNEDPYPGKMVQASLLGVAQEPPHTVSSVKVTVEGKIEKDFSTGATKGTVSAKVEY